MIESLKDIYFYNAKALAEMLREGAITEHVAVKHMVAVAVLGGIGIEMPLTVDTNGGPSVLYQFIIYIITAVISFYGIWLTHQVNSKGDGKDYFLRFTALTLPVSIQLFVLFLWVGLALLALSYALVSEVAGALIIFGIFNIALIAFVIMFFIRMRNYIAIAAGANE